MSASGPFVRAIVVTTGRVGYLEETLTALARQDRPVDAWHLVVVGRSHAGEQDLGVPPGLGIPVTTVKVSTFGEAVDSILSSYPGVEDEWLWLLHDDSAPATTCLSRLIAATRRRRTVGVAGPVQVRWEDPGRLVSVGITVSRSGRRFNVVDQDDVDQGQHEGREDVLAVGLAGALVRRAAWDRLGGTDPAYGVFGDSTDFCRRTWRAGYDVVVVPRARIRHAQATLSGGQADRAEEHRRNHVRIRTSEWYHGLAWAKWWTIPLIVLRAILSGIGRALVRLAAGEPRLAIADLAVPPALVGRLGRLRRSRAAIARAGKVPVERPLLASFADVVGQLRTREFGLYEAWRAEHRPNDIQRGELSRLRVRRRWALGGVSIVLVAISVAQYGTWFAPLFRGDMLVGSAPGATDVSLGDLWGRSFSGWSDSGLGGGALDGTFAALMIPLSLVGGLATGIGLLLGLSTVLAGISAWFAAGAASRSLWARSLAAVAWGVWPTLIASVADGRVGAVLVHILLPLLALALARASSLFRKERLGDGEGFPKGRFGSQGAAAFAAVLLVAITVASPILLAPLVLVILALVVLARGYRRRMALIALPALIVQGPALWQTWLEREGERWWAFLVREPGPALASDPVSSWDLLWGIGEAPPDWPAATDAGDLVLTYLVGAVLVAAALLAITGTRSAVATRMGWFVAAAGLVVAIVAQRTTAVAASPDGTPAANGWPGPGLSLLALGLMMAVLSSLGAGRADPGHRSRVVAAVLLTGVLAVHVTASVWPGREFGGDVHPVGTSVLPLVANLERSTEPSTRVLVLSSLEDGSVSYSVLGSDGYSALLGRAHLSADGSPPSGEGDAADLSVLAPAVSSLAGSGTGAVDLLRDWGIGVVVVTPGSDELERHLQLVADLDLIGVSDLGISWRVQSSPGGEKVSRAWLEEPSGDRLPLPSDPTGLAVQIPEGDPGRVLVIAVSSDARWWATFDDEELLPMDVDGRQGFRVGGDSGVLRVGYADPLYRTWSILALVAVAWAVLGGIPLRDRAYRGRTR